MRSPCNDIFYTVINWNSVYIMHGRGLPIFWKVYMYIYWIFCDFIALRYQTWFISFYQDFHEYYEKAHILLIIINIILVGLLLTLAFFFITQHQIGKMNRTKLPIRERIGNIPQFPIGVDVAVAEVGTTNRIGFQLLMYQTYVSLWIVIMAKKYKFIQKPF